MAKKKQKIVDQWPVSTIPEQYEVSKWAGQPHFKCLLCPFDALQLEAIHSHLVNAHNSEKALELVVGAEGIKQQPAPEPAAEPENNRVVAIFEMSEEDVEKLLKQGDENNGTSEPD